MRKGKLLAALMLICAISLAGCHSMVPPSSDDLIVYASFYPIYLLASEIARDVPGIEIRCLTQPQAGCIRSYALSDWDRANLAQADALIRGGRNLETFADLGLAGFEVLGGLTLLNETEVLPEGDDEAGHDKGANPWLFLSVEGTIAMTSSLSAGLSALDPVGASKYDSNARSLRSKLRSLQNEIAPARAKVSGTKVAIFHEGLPYVAGDLGLEIAVTIRRESATDLSSTELSEAIEAMRAAGVTVLLIEKQAPDRLLRALSDAGLRVAKIDTMTGHTEADFEVYRRAVLDNASQIERAAGDE